MRGRGCVDVYAAGIQLIGGVLGDCRRDCEGLSCMEEGIAGILLGLGTMLLVSGVLVGLVAVLARRAPQD